MDKVTGDHIGDGIYLDDLGHMIRTSTPREFGVHEIFYGPAELWEFLVWCIRHGWLTKEAVETLLTRFPAEEEKPDA